MLQLTAPGREGALTYTSVHLEEGLCLGFHVRFEEAKLWRHDFGLRTSREVPGAFPKLPLKHQEALHELQSKLLKGEIYRGLYRELL